MAVKTGISWVQDENGTRGDSWNPLTGCTEISPGCDHCYARVVAERAQRNPKLNAAKNGNPYAKGFELTLHPHRLDEPKRKRDPRAYFVNSISDMFHAKVPRDYIKQIFAVMNDQQRHRFMILTKRPERALQLSRDLQMGLIWTPNIWMGTTVEDWDRRHRIDTLREIPAAVRFISAEPLLGSLLHPPGNDWGPDLEPGPYKLNLEGIHWLICGGESGAGARRFDLAWARELREACAEQGVAYFLKQMGKAPYDSGGGKNGQPIYPSFPGKGDEPEYWPEDLRVQQMPVRP